MRVVVDDDVQAVAGFMQANVPASRLTSVANALAVLAPVLWGKFEPEQVQALRLEGEVITAGSRTPAASTE